MRCPDCNKFVSLETQEPEVDAIDIDAETGSINCEVRVVRACADCGTELKDYNFSLTGEVDSDIVDAHKGEIEGPDGVIVEHELSIEEDGVNVDETGGGRYAKNYIELQVSAIVSCSCKGNLGGEGKKGLQIELTDKAAASDFEECC